MKENSNYKKFFYGGWSKRRQNLISLKIKNMKGIDYYEKKYSNNSDFNNNRNYNGSNI